MRCAVVVVLLLLSPLAGYGATLPGISVETIAETNGFLTSLVIDSQNRIVYSATDGGIFRLEGNTSRRLATVPTAAEGNAALLGIAMYDEGHVIAHYVAPDLMSDLVSMVSIVDGSIVELARFVCDDGRVCSSEHHGGNPIVSPDGTIYVGLGDFGGGPRAQHATNPGGKIFKFKPGEAPVRVAMGLRNPYDFALDPVTGRMVVGDNGPMAGDEINLMPEGSNGGWPYTWGLEKSIEGMLAPAYVFLETVAPTGLMLASGRGVLPARSLLVASFVTRALYFFPKIDGDKLDQPLTVISRETSMIIDVVEDRDGNVIFGTPQAIYRLKLPRRGDVDGNGVVDARDNDALAREILDGDENTVYTIHRGSYPATWGADVNGDGMIDTRDLVDLAKLRSARRRLARP
ncbi:MAG: PQQ-dependent sugar dehydrogenase [Thermoanaerobaculia bacterium]